VRLSDEDRRRLTAYILADQSNALALRRENPSLVEEAILDPGLMARLSADPALFATLILGLKPTPFQLKFLNSTSKRIIIRWSRQSGKTTFLAAYAVWFAVTHPASTALIVAPSRRQSMILNEIIQGLIDGAPKRIRAAFLRRRLRTVTYLRNGSKIVALPNSENLLRGYTAHLIILDEAAFFQNDESIFQHVLTPMLATTGGKMIVSSTPWGKNTQFYRISNDPAWETHHATWRDAVEAGLYRPDFLEDVHRTRDTLPLTYRVEYEAEFAEEADTWLTQDLLAKACSHDLDYESFDAANTGDFYAGVDLAERVDYTAIAVIRREGRSLTLSHMHRFPLGTSLAACIGYLKVLGERWNRMRATYVDSTKHGDYIIRDMQEAGVKNPRGVFLTQDTKQEAAQILRQRLAEGVLRIPYDRSLLDELNLEQYELTKTGRVTLTHASGTHDDRFWALALAAYAAEKETHPSKPIAKTF
jgi:phage FluMu gp28-like protein